MLGNLLFKRTPKSFHIFQTQTGARFMMIFGQKHYGFCKDLLLFKKEEKIGTL